MLDKHYYYRTLQRQLINSIRNTALKPAWPLVCGLFALLAFGGCENDLAEVKALGLGDNLEAETGQNVEILYSEMGNVTTRIEAPTLINLNNEEGETEFPDGLKMFFYNNQKKVTSRVKANYGLTNDKKGEMLVRGDVVVTNDAGKKLNSEELIWKRKEKRIYSDKFVKITTPTEIVMGYGLRAAEDFSDYEILDIHDSRIIVDNNKDENTE